jgi:hypothetical protein
MVRPTRHAIRTIGRRLAALALGCLVIGHAQAQEAPVVAAIEAAYLTKFSDFVEWPAGEADTLCVLAPEATSRLIEQAESKLPADADHARFHRLASASEAKDCRVLFIGDPAVDAAAPALAGMPVLVVTDRAADGHKGVINFVIRDDRVRFEIDDAEAGRRGLVISSKLLSLAVAVKPRA